MIPAVIETKGIRIIVGNVIRSFLLDVIKLMVSCLNDLVCAVEVSRLIFSKSSSLGFTDMVDGWKILTLFGI